MESLVGVIKDNVTQEFLKYNPVITVLDKFRQVITANTVTLCRNGERPFNMLEIQCFTEILSR